MTATKPITTTLIPSWQDPLIMFINIRWLKVSFSNFFFSHDFTYNKHKKHLEMNLYGMRLLIEWIKYPEDLVCIISCFNVCRTPVAMFKESLRIYVCLVLVGYSD